MEKFDVKTARLLVKTLNNFIIALNHVYALFSEIGVDKRSLRCLVKSNDLCRATIMEAFLLLGKHDREEFHKVFGNYLIKDNENK